VTARIPRPGPAAGKAWNQGWDKAMADPAVAPDLPLDQRTVAFIREVAATLRTGGDPA
jgi:hypothetical protein